MAISKGLQEKLDYYEQVYYALDEPVPFKGGLEIYPVLVSDYYKFYSCLGCLTMDKTMKFDFDESGRLKYDAFGKPMKVTNIKGLGQTYLGYLIDTMRDEHMGEQVTLQVMQLFELAFHVQKGMYCPKCHKEISYEEVFQGMNAYIDNALAEAQSFYKEAIISEIVKQKGLTEIPGDTSELEKELQDNNVSLNLPQDIKSKVIQKARYEYSQKSLMCPDCGESMRDIFSIKTNEYGMSSLVVKDVEINDEEFEELKAIIPRQNILDYDGDRDIDPELKEELELKAQLQNSDYTSPTLEKQLVCVGISTGYTIEYLKTLSIRKLSMMLKLIDKKETYYAQYQGAMSGMVSFKEDPKHWIFSDDKKNIKNELTDLKDFEKKFDMVT